jgi:hypothetical protein
MAITPSIEKKELKELKELTFNQKYQVIECGEEAISINSQSQ